MARLTFKNTAVKSKNLVSAKLPQRVLWLMAILSKVANLLFSYSLPPSSIGVHSHRKEFSPLGVISFLKEKIPFGRAS